MDEKLSMILECLERLEKKVDKLDREMCVLSKHAPFVDSLAESGVVKVVGSLGRMINSIGYWRRGELEN